MCFVFDAKQEVYTKDGTKFHKKGCSEVRLPYRSRSAPRLGVDVRERRQIVSQQLKVCAASFAGDTSIYRMRMH